MAHSLSASSLVFWRPLLCSLLMQSNHVEHSLGDLALSLCPERVEEVHLLVSSLLLVANVGSAFHRAIFSPPFFFRSAKIRILPIHSRVSVTFHIWLLSHFNSKNCIFKQELLEVQFKSWNMKTIILAFSTILIFT